ncbi:hypothetical protein FA95DRAFT_1613568 [Auriscalpium vulgare]|uniref:Uncharacterized protein n=1 Tax=Auriscalpium vulgare TaxID=40419 RepID=A0ACB8R235_9AGAM|nr:hypothetical protein FA95DRAFT_1613568 [Auriscalpium vulgare]
MASWAPLWELEDGEIVEDSTRPELQQAGPSAQQEENIRAESAVAARGEQDVQDSAMLATQGKGKGKGKARARTPSINEGAAPEEDIVAEAFDEDIQEAIRQSRREQDVANMPAAQSAASTSQVVSERVVAQPSVFRDSVAAAHTTHQRSVPRHVAVAAMPMELQLMVMEWVYRNTQADEIWYTTLRWIWWVTLRSCLLVCKAWTDPAQRLLLRRLPFPLRFCFGLQKHSHAKLLLRTIRARPLLANHIISVVLDLKKIDSESSSPAAHLLKLCKRITCIRVEGADYSSMEWHQFLRRLRSSDLHPVVLRISDAHPSGIADLVGMWASTLRILEFSILEVGGMGIPRWRQMDLSSLEALSIERFTGLNMITPDAGWPALRELRLKPAFLGCAADRHRVYEDYSHSVFSSGMLSQINTLWIEGAYPPPEFFLRIIHLESFGFSELPEDNIFSFPDTLRHVGWHHRFLDFRTPDLRSFFSALRTLPNLQCVTMTPDKSRYIGQGRIEIEEFCREIGVALVICMGMARLRVQFIHFFLWDLIPAD